MNKETLINLLRESEETYIKEKYKIVLLSNRVRNKNIISDLQELEEELTRKIEHLREVIESVIVSSGNIIDRSTGVYEYETMQKGRQYRVSLNKKAEILKSREDIKAISNNKVKHMLKMYKEDVKLIESHVREEE